MLGSVPPTARWQSNPSRLAAAAVMRAWLLCAPPPVTSTSQPSACASAHRNSSLRALLPPSASPVRSSRLTSTRGPPSHSENRSIGSNAVGSCASRTRGTSGPMSSGRIVAAAQPPPHRNAGTGGGERATDRDRRTGGRHRHAVAQPHRMLEVAYLPLPLASEPRELLVRVHGDRVADHLEHRQVGDRVAVRIRHREIDVLPRRELPDRLRLVCSVRVELELARVVPVGVYSGTGAHTLVSAEEL